MLESEFKYYTDNQEELVKKHEGKFLIIIGQEVVDAYDTELQAYTSAKNKYGPGKFLIQHCLPGRDSFTQTYHSRVSFP